MNGLLWLQRPQGQISGMTSLASSCGFRVGRTALRVTQKSRTRSPSPARTCTVAQTPLPRSSSLDEGLLLKSNSLERSSQKSVAYAFQNSGYNSPGNGLFTRSHSFEEGLRVKQDNGTQRKADSSLDRSKPKFTEVKVDEKSLSVAAQLPPRKLSYDEAMRSNVNTEIQNDWKQELASIVARGEMIPDTYVCSLVRETLLSPQVLERNGWLLDGFPRTVAQAETMLSDISKNFSSLKPTAMIVLEVSDEELLDRMIFRRIDPVTGKIYNLKTRPPKEAEIMRRLIQREDDREEVVRRRISIYRRTAAQIENVFVSYGIPILRVDGSAKRSCEGVFCEIQAVLENLRLTLGSTEPPRLVLSGPPGCGKGTQAELISKVYSLFHLSTGNIVRDMLNGKPSYESEPRDLRSVGIVFGRDSQFWHNVSSRKNTCQHETSFCMSSMPSSNVITSSLS
jgi:adenylate kinase family enzyme